MIQSTHNVLIGKACPASYTNIGALTDGDVALFDENRELIATAAAAVDATSLYVGVCHGTVNVTMPDGDVEAKPNIEFSQEIQKAGKPSAVIGEYTAPTKQKVTVTLTSATIVAGNRYVVRIIYKDFLEAMDKDDNEGVNSINEYSIVEMDVFFYTTIPGALLSNQPESVPGAVIAVATKANPGKGYWKQVRDAEFRNMPYKGHVFIDAYPEISQDRRVVKDAQYDYAIVECDNLYLSNDNQYIKTTPMTVEVYCPSLKDSIVDKGIQSFIAGKTIS